MALPTFNHIHYTSLYDIVIYLDNTVAIIAIYIAILMRYYQPNIDHLFVYLPVPALTNSQEASIILSV